MSREDDDPFGLKLKPKTPGHEVGQALDSLSIHELTDRIGLLRDEIVRLERARDAKGAASSAANAVFRRPA